MNNKLKEILSQVYELEGLLLTAENHGKNTNSLVFELIHKKVENITALDKSIDTSIFDSEMNPTIEKPMSLEETAPQQYEMLGADSCGAECDDTCNDELQQSSDGECEALGANIKFDQGADSNDDDDTEPFATDEEFEPENEEPIEPCNHVEDIPIDEDIEENVEEEEVEVNNDDYEEEESNTTDTLDPEYDDTELDDEQEYDTDPEEVVDSISVEDAVVRKNSKNLKKAFSLNDRFRFRRELFENSDVQMTNTLNMVEAMQSYTEAEDYFYTDLQWDADSPEVQEFMAIIKNHFS